MGHWVSGKCGSVHESSVRPQVCPECVTPSTAEKVLVEVSHLHRITVAVCPHPSVCHPKGVGVFLGCRAGHGCSPGLLGCGTGCGCSLVPPTVRGVFDGPWCRPSYPKGSSGRPSSVWSAPVPLPRNPNSLGPTPFPLVPTGEYPFPKKDPCSFTRL